MRINVTLLILVLASLACMEPVATATPSAIPDNTPQASTPTLPSPTVTASPTATPEPGTTLATVAQPVVNVRAEPDGAVIGELLAGETVTVLECLDNWCKIEHPFGWVWAGCLDPNPEGLGCQSR